MLLFVLKSSNCCFKNVMLSIKLAMHIACNLDESISFNIFGLLKIIS